jgi:hypothetical protein
MDFKLQIDPGALVNLPDVKERAISISVDPTNLVVKFGAEFNTTIDRSAVEKAEEMGDPRPAVYFPMGLSAAVQQLGRDTVCMVTSYQGLVKIDFNRDVEATVHPTDYTGKGGQTEGQQVQFRHLVLSMQNPSGLIAALNERTVAAR